MSGIDTLACLPLPFAGALRRGLLIPLLLLRWALPRLFGWTLGFKDALVSDETPRRALRRRAVIICII